MATFYWVGGSGDWNATNTANWSISSGGAGGSGPPTSTDDVIFDAGSNTGTDPFTVTVTGTTSAPAVCQDFSTGGAGGALDGAMTLTMGATAQLDCYGSFTAPATNFSTSGTSGANIRFASTSTGKTVTTNGVLFTGINFRFIGSGGEWTLGSAITIASLVLEGGTFNTGNYNVTGISMFRTQSLATTTASLGSSTLSFNGAGPVNFSVTTDFTLNANTSTITCSNTSPTFTGGGQTFYNVTFSSAANGVTTINGANTFNNLTQTSRSATGRRRVNISDNQIVNGTLTLGAANTAIRRIWVSSNTIGTQRTITLNGTLATLADVDFRDIVAAGTVATPWTGTRLGNCLGNSNITFDAPKIVYWNLAGTQNWSATAWATTNNGAPAVNNFPLAQDTATFTEAGAAGTVTIDADWQIGSIQMADGVSNRTTAFTFNTSTFFIFIYGNITFFSSLTLSGTGTMSFDSRAITQTITSAGVSIPQSIIVNALSGTFQLADNLTSTGTSFTLTQGTLDLNDYTLTCVTFSSSNTNTRSIDFGTSGQITVTGNNATVWTTATATNFTYAGTSNVVFNYSGSTGTRTVSNHSTGGTESNALNYSFTAGTDIVTISASGVAKNVIYTGFTGAGNLTGTMYGNLVLDSGMTVVSGSSGTTFAATSGTQEITTNGVSIDRPLGVNAPGATVQLQDNLTIGSTRTFNLIAGTLDLDDNTLSTGLFSSNNANTRAIAFGTTGQIDVTGTGTVWSCATLTNFSYTGTPTVNFTYSGSVSRNLDHGVTAGTESNAFNFNIVAGTGTFGTTQLNNKVKNLNFTGYSGSAALWGGGFIYGNLTLSSTQTITSSNLTTTFGATSGTQQITTNGVAIDRSIAVNAPGATVQLQDALTMGATRTLTLTAGTLDSDGYAVSTGLFNGSGTTARTLSMGASTWTITGAGTAWDLTDTTNLTLNSDTSTISMTGSSAHTFSGGSQTYYNLNVGGTGDLTIVGDNTFNEISDSVDGSTVYFTAGSTTTTTAFTVDGGVGDLILFRSTTPGSVWFLEQATGAVSISYVDIQDSDASGGATFQCINGVNSGNNTGWQFIDSGGSGGNFFIFF